uniref:Uncharacterized protein n=1 Tax=Rhizophora mucronata TaxID=61149 RepID=A0A2P2R0J7_RHIMU
MLVEGLVYNDEDVLTFEQSSYFRLKALHGKP